MSSQAKKQWFWSVLFALLGNAIVTAMKFTWFAFSGSGALFSEAVHSLADTFNQGFLMVGIRRSSRNANDVYAYGFGKERFFWALISACGIFFLWAWVTLYHGVELLLNPHSLHVSTFSFVVLAVSFVVESFTFAIAVRELRRSHPYAWWKHLMIHGDPVTLAVVYEDGVACLWVLIACASLILYTVTWNSIWDGIWSTIVGLLLGVMAIILIMKNRAFLLGKAIPPKLRKEIIEHIESDPIIDKVLDFKSSILDVDVYHIKCEIECNGTALMKELGRNNFFRNEYEDVKDDYQAFLEFCVDFTGRLPRLMGTRIDELEASIREKFPQVRHIDLEIN